MCIICGEDHPDYFEDTRDDFCIRCKDLMNCWFKDAYNDMKVVAKAGRGKELTMMEFADALEVYGQEKWRDEYERSKNRKKNEQRANGV